MKQILSFGPYSVKITHSDKILFPESNLTKDGLIAYYTFVGPVMVRYTKHRPISMVRYPDGINHDGFFQKDASDYFPQWIATKKIKKEDGSYTKYVIINNTATLVYLANQGCITPHLWLSKIDKLDYPDRMIFDFDPSSLDLSGRDSSSKGFERVRKGAFLYKKLLDTLGLPSFVMTTGSRGVHVIVPIRREKNFTWVRRFAYDMAQYLVTLYPNVFTLAMRKKDRGNLVFLDTLRNAFGQTGVAPYAVRPKPGAPVAAPITWRELKDPALQSNTYTVQTMQKRLDTVGDLFRGMSRRAVSLVRARTMFDELTKKKRQNLKNE